MKLIIDKPNKRIEGDYLFLESKIFLEDKMIYNLWYKIEKEYEEYINEDNGNPFLITLIPYIVKHNYDVKINSKISSKLYYQINTYLLPLLCKEFNKKKINIECELTDERYEGEGVGASVSCGVDSFYTILKHKDQKDTKYNITHLAFFNAGSHGEYGGESARKLYEERLIEIKKFCKHHNYKLVTVDSNMNELIMMNHEKTHTFRTLGCVYVLEKLFGKYYFASGLGFNGSKISEEDTAYYDILNVHCLSNENISFYCSGLETTRQEKIKFISNFPETYDSLNVCVRDEWKNCSDCEKCIRTITALESIGKINNYKKVFDLEKYYKNKNKNHRLMLKYQNDSIKKEIYKEIVESYKQNNVKISNVAKITSYFPNKEDIKKTIKKILPKKILKLIKKNKVNNSWTD